VHTAAAAAAAAVNTTNSSEGGEWGRHQHQIVSVNYGSFTWGLKAANEQLLLQMSKLPVLRT
jgi:hypothetical protein